MKKGMRRNHEHSVFSLILYRHLGALSSDPESDLFGALFLWSTFTFAISLLPMLPMRSLLLFALRHLTFAVRRGNSRDSLATKDGEESKQSGIFLLLVCIMLRVACRYVDVWSLALGSPGGTISGFRVIYMKSLNTAQIFNLIHCAFLLKTCTPTCTPFFSWNVYMCRRFLRLIYKLWLHFILRFQIL